MLLATLFALTLGQAAAAPPATAQQAPAPAPQAAASGRTPAQQARLDAQRRHNGAVSCENRAPTGSVMNRQMCRTERRVQADAARARNYVSEVTRGSVNEPHPDVSGE
jgi:invasion protein IalB